MYHTKGHIILPPRRRVEQTTDSSTTVFDLPSDDLVTEGGQIDLLVFPMVELADAESANDFNEFLNF